MTETEERAVSALEQLFRENPSSTSILFRLNSADQTELTIEVLLTSNARKSNRDGTNR